MAVPLPNTNYLLNLNPWDDNPIYRDIVLQTWLAEIVTNLGGGSGVPLAPIAPYSTLSNNTALTAAPVAAQQLLLGGAPGADANAPFYAGYFVVPSAAQGNVYTEFVLQGLSSGTSSAADFDVPADNATSTTHRVLFGINSSGYTNSGISTYPFGANNAYLISESDDLFAGTYGANTVHIFSNSADVAQFTQTAINVPSTVSSGLQLFNTTDQVTNFDKLQVNWLTNRVFIHTQSGGSGSTRALILGSGTNNNQLTLNPSGSSGIYFQAAQNAVAGNIIVFDNSTGNAGGGAGIAQVGSAFTFTVNQTSTASFTDLLVNRTNSNPGSGTQRLLDLQVGSVSQFNVTPGGNVSITGFYSSGSSTFATSTTIGGALTVSNGAVLSSALGYSFGAPSITGGAALAIAASTYTLTGTATTANFQGTYFGIPTFTNASAGTLTNASTVYIAGQPAAAGSQVITTPWSLYVASGNVFLGNQVNGSGWVMNNSGRLTTYNNVTTAGTGVTPVVAAPRQTAVTNTTATLATYTVPGADSTYRISANVQVTAATAAAMTVVCTYTDETNTSRAQTIPFCQLAGTFLTSITNVTGVGPYEGATLEIRCKASTTIVFTTSGTTTGITYNVQGTITQLA